MSHTSSKSWVSAQQAEIIHWQSVKKNIDHMRFDRSPFVPSDLPEWLEHRSAMIQDHKKEQEEIMLQKEALKNNSHGRRILHLIYPAFGGRDFGDGRSGVLALPSVWVHPVEGSSCPPWPCREELKEEGDERHTSGFTRFLPIPRVPGNETVVYKQRPFLLHSTLDYVKPVARVHHSLLPEGYPHEYICHQSSVLSVRCSPEVSEVYEVYDMSEHADDYLYDTISEDERVAYEWKHRHGMSRRSSSSAADHEPPMTPECDLAAVMNKQAEQMGMKLNVHANTFKMSLPKNNSAREESPIKSFHIFVPPKSHSFHEECSPVSILNYNPDQDMDAHEIDINIGPMLAPTA
ncbi:MAG: hypothetical protein MMC33_000036 [Icmadophila ericetorum]|nr:hypothetical protein [Icmadophila ericetorum]